MRIRIVAITALLFVLAGAILNFNSAAPMPMAPDFYSRRIDSLDQFEKMAASADGLVRGGLSVKFLIDWRSRKNPAIYFLNENYKEGRKVPEYVKLHYPFANKALNYFNGLDAFNQTTYFEPDFNRREFTAGTVQLYEFGAESGGAPRTLGIQFYPQDLIREQGLLEAVRMVRKNLHIPGIPLAVVAYSSSQTFITVRRQLEEEGVQPLTVEAILGNIRYIPMNLGKTYGYIKMFPTSQDELTPLDIPVFKDLPLDLSVVAGVISTTAQDPGSHVNLKSKERRTPNLVIRDQAMIDELREFAEQGIPVMLDVTDREPVIKRATPQEVTKAYESRRPQRWKSLPNPIPAKLDEWEYDKMCAGNARNCLEASNKFGGKAAGLGLLAHRNVAGMNSDIQKLAGYRLTPYGFGVPLTFYRDFLNANPSLKVMIDELIVREKGSNPVSPAERKAMVDKIQRAFYAATVPRDLLDVVNRELGKLKEKVESENPAIELKKVKVRSSANVEDVEQSGKEPGFNGAGLHDSFSARIKPDPDPNGPCTVVPGGEDDSEAAVTKQKVDPQSVACAIKAVYASLWNKRAVEERNFRKLDHATALMGLAIVPGYDFLAKLKDDKAPPNGMEETANSVLVTRVLNTEAVNGYTLTTQIAPNLVTNPFPGSRAEVGFVAFFISSEPWSFTFTQMAKPRRESPSRNDAILERAQMIRTVQVAQAVETAYCTINAKYYRSTCTHELCSCDFVRLDPRKPRALDMEFKFLGSQRILLKQMREYSGN